MFGSNYFGGQSQDRSRIGQSERCGFSPAHEFCFDTFQLRSPCRQCRHPEVSVQVAGCHVEFAEDSSEQKTKVVGLS